MQSTHIDFEENASADKAVRMLAASTDEFEAYVQPHAARLATLANQVAKLYGLARIDCLNLRLAALLHDLGEAVMKRDYIKRSGTLTADERLDLTRHPVIGESEAARVGVPRAAQLIVRWHHEWWNGTGYPDMLRGTQIPLPARILRVVDAYHALISPRPFRSAYNDLEACRMLTRHAAIEFDPELVQAFFELKSSESRV